MQANTRSPDIRSLHWSSKHNIRAVRVSAPALPQQHGQHVVLHLDAVADCSAVTLECATVAAARLWPGRITRSPLLASRKASTLLCALSSPSDAVLAVRILHDELIEGRTARAAGKRRTRPFRMDQIISLLVDADEELLGVCLARWALEQGVSRAALKERAGELYYEVVLELAGMVGGQQQQQQQQQAQRTPSEGTPTLRGQQQQQQQQEVQQSWAELWPPAGSEASSGEESDWYLIDSSDPQQPSIHCLQRVRPYQAVAEMLRSVARDKGQSNADAALLSSLARRQAQLAQGRSDVPSLPPLSIGSSDSQSASRTEAQLSVLSPWPLAISQAVLATAGLDVVPCSTCSGGRSDSRDAWQSPAGDAASSRDQRAFIVEASTVVSSAGRTSQSGGSTVELVCDADWGASLQGMLDQRQASQSASRGSSGSLGGKSRHQTPAAQSPQQAALHIVTASLALAREGGSLVSAAALSHMAAQQADSTHLGPASEDSDPSCLSSSIVPVAAVSLAEWGPSTAAMRAAALSSPESLGLIDEARLAGLLGCGSSRLVMDGIAWTG